MPAASSGYEVVRQAHNGSTPVVLNAPTGTYVVWAFNVYDSSGVGGGLEDKIVLDNNAPEREPIFDGNGNITGVDFGIGPATQNAVLVCVGA